MALGSKSLEYTTVGFQENAVKLTFTVSKRSEDVLLDSKQSLLTENISESNKSSFDEKNFLEKCRVP